MTEISELVHDATDILAHLFFACGTADRVAVRSPAGDLEGTFRAPLGDQVVIAHHALAPSLAAGTHVRVEYAGPGDTYTFESEVVSSGAQVLALRLPRVIECADRRLAARVSLPAGANVALVLVGRPSMPRCVVQDLSAGGVGFLVPESVGALTMGQVVPARLEVPLQAPFAMEIEVRHVRELDAGGRVGARFAALAPQERERLVGLLRRWLA